MTGKTGRRLVRGGLAAAAFALAAYEYSSGGFSGMTAMLALLGVFFGFQAATGAG